jgi:hypothetical protein
MRYCLRETAKAPRRPPALAPVEHPRTSLDMSSAVRTSSHTAPKVVADAVAAVERVAHWQPTSRRFLDYFIVMQALGGILLAILFLTAATGRVRRYATWLSFCVAWLVSCLSYVMLCVPSSAAASLRRLKETLQVVLWATVRRGTGLQALPLAGSPHLRRARTVRACITAYANAVDTRCSCAFATFSLVIQLCITTRLSVIFGPTETPRATVFWVRVAHARTVLYH